MKKVKIFNIKMYEEFHGEYRDNLGSGILPYCYITKRFLIGLRSYEVKEPGTWAIFGGKLYKEEGIEETIKEAALRELEEETGYKGSIRLIDGHIYKDGSFKYYNYIGKIPYEYEPELNWEHDDAIWVTYKELLSMDDLHYGLQEFLIKSKEIFENL